MQKERLVIIILVATLIATISIAYAITTWNGTVTINVTPNTNFHVTNQLGQNLTSFSVGITLTGTYNYEYKIFNDGNTPIIINITPSGTLPTGTTAIWNTTFPTSAINIGQNIGAKLTVDVQQAGTGNYSWAWTSMASS